MRGLTIFIIEGGKDDKLIITKWSNHLRFSIGDILTTDALFLNENNDMEFEYIINEKEYLTDISFDDMYSHPDLKHITSFYGYEIYRVYVNSTDVIDISYRLKPTEL